MRTGFLVLALAAGLVAPSAASPAEQIRIGSYCSTSGDVCYGIFQQGQTFRFELTLAARYFSRYQICVQPPSGASTCKTFPVRRRGQQFGGTVIWNRYFPSRGPGRYRVTWKQNGQRLGPTLRFAVVPTPAS
jgi:hypothetical protein